MELIIMDDMRRSLFILTFLTILVLPHSSWADLAGRDARVAVAVADLRKEPISTPAERGHDPSEESQLLYGELVSVLEEKNGWARVSAPQQMEFTHTNRWEGYPGWVESAALVPAPEKWNPTAVLRAKWVSVREQPNPESPARLKLSAGTRLPLAATPTLPHPEPQNGWWQILLLDGATGWVQAEDLLTQKALSDLQDKPAQWRASVVSAARLFIGDPYYWGGRSSYDPGASAPPHTGVDCSGLVGLAYQAGGSTIPRDSHEQWMNARKIRREELQPADLIFLFDPNQSDRVNHVMLYVGNGKAIEGPGTSEAIREIDLDERLKEIPDRAAAYGSYLPRE